jgi:carotenoid 1,2-hydratase
MRGVDIRPPAAPRADEPCDAAGNLSLQEEAGGVDRGPAAGCEPGCGPRFDAPIAPGGYLWWYVDAFSDDGRYGITLIAQVGSCFSPYYASARRRRNSDPLNHNSLNVALYGEVKRWSMTERGRSALHREASRLEIGPSSLSWDGNCLTIRIDEIAVPIPRRIRGVVKLYPRAVAGQPYFLDGAGRHRWAPIAPGARVEVQLDRPSLRWSGHGYFDSNWGNEPLEKAFRYWEWSRAELRDGGTAVLYDATRRDGQRTELGLHFDPAGGVERIEVPPHAKLPTTAWRMQRGTRVDAQKSARVTETLENTPFYTRSMLSTHMLGEPVIAMHESVCLDRFDSRWVQVLLPFRIPRVPGN